MTSEERRGPIRRCTWAQYRRSWLTCKVAGRHLSRRRGQAGPEGVSCHFDSVTWAEAHLVPGVCPSLVKDAERKDPLTTAAGCCIRAPLLQGGNGPETRHGRGTGPRLGLSARWRPWTIPWPARPGAPEGRTFASAPCPEQCLARSRCAVNTCLRQHDGVGLPEPPPHIHMNENVNL